jgi:hypothetical protein
VRKVPFLIAILLGNVAFAQNNNRIPNYICTGANNAAGMHYVVRVTDLYWAKQSKIDIFWVSTYGSEHVGELNVEKQKLSPNGLEYYQNAIDLSGSGAKAKKDFSLKLIPANGSLFGEMKWDVGMRTRHVRVKLACEKVTIPKSPF